MTSLLKRPRHRQCAVEGIDCGGAGFHVLNAYRVSSARLTDDVEGFKVHAETFRTPCVCLAGEAWADKRRKGIAA